MTAISSPRSSCLTFIAPQPNRFPGDRCGTRPSRWLRFAQLLPGPGARCGWTSCSPAASPTGRPPDRPYVIVNFVASVDGRAAWPGARAASATTATGDVPRPARAASTRSWPGPATLRAERYGRILGSSRAARARAGGGDWPPSRWPAVLTRSGDLRSRSPCSPNPRPGRRLQRRRRSTLGGVAPRSRSSSLEPADELTFLTALRASARATTASGCCCARAARRCSARSCASGCVDELFLTLAPQAHRRRNRPGHHRRARAAGARDRWSWPG